MSRVNRHGQQEWSRRQFLARAIAVGVGDAVVGAVGISPAAAKKGNAVDDFLRMELKAGAFPGAAVVATRGGKPLHERFLGTYCGRHRRANALDSSVVHMFFSISKLITSTVVVMAQQDGGFEYDDPVWKHIPEYRGGGKDATTVRHLLTHAAGVPNVPLASVETEAKWKAAVRTLCAAKVEWPPGSKTQYHGLTGHFLAAEVVRRLSGGQPWAEICRQRLFEPLGATTLSFQLPGEGEAFALTPRPDKLPSRYGAIYATAVGHPAGACVGTVGDLIKVLQLHLNGGRWGERVLIKPEALAEMHRVQYAREICAAVKAGKPPAHGSWGLGILIKGDGASAGGHAWFGIRDLTGPRVFGHAGFDTVIAVADPDTQVAMVFLTTDSPASSEKTIALRNGVSERVFELAARG